VSSLFRKGVFKTVMYLWKGSTHTSTKNIPSINCGLEVLQDPVWRNHMLLKSVYAGWEMTLPDTRPAAIPDTSSSTFYRDREKIILQP